MVWTGARLRPNFVSAIVRDFLDVVPFKARHSRLILLSTDWHHYHQSNIIVYSYTTTECHVCCRTTYERIAKRSAQSYDWVESHQNYYVYGLILDIIPGALIVTIECHNYIITLCFWRTYLTEILSQQAWKATLNMYVKVHAHTPV